MSPSFVVFILTLLVVIPARAEELLTFSTPPTQVNAKQTITILEKAYAKLGIQIAVKELPSARSLLEANDGRTDGEVHRIAGIESANPNLIRIPVPIRIIEGMAFSCGAPVAVNGWQSIRDLHIGIRAGIKFFENGTKDMNHVSKIASVDHLFTLLFMRRLDVVVVDRSWEQEQRDRDKSSCLVTNEPPIVVIELYHYLHNRHADLVPAITAVLQEMQDSGEIKRIHAGIISED